MNKSLIIIIAIAIMVSVGIAVYKLLIEPAQLKREYMSCVESAEKADYERWQEIERRIVVQKIIRDQEWKQVDEAIANYELSIDLQDCIEETVRSCNEKRGGRIFTALCDDKDYQKSKCTLQKRYEIENSAIEADRALHSLNQDLNLGGEILQKELEECEKHFKMFSESY